MLEIKNISYKYNQNLALDDVSLTLAPGIYGLIGPNGAGKSTLIHLIASVLKLQQGSINFSSDEKGKRPTIGLMPQMFNGYNHFKAYQFLMYVASLKKMDKQKAQQQIKTLVKAVELEDVMHRKIGAYSSGMKQRLMLVQALLDDPKILILDEPTAGLDPFQRIKIRQLIASVAANKIVMLATHIMSDIEMLASHYIFMDKGKIRFAGTVEAAYQKAHGHVYEGVYDHLITEATISNAIPNPQGYVIRYIHDIKLSSEDVIVKANAEELFLYFLGAHHAS
jgi:ABC-type multidrug transport system ATPase subunit